jgi:hypothetical protein
MQPSATIGGGTCRALQPTIRRLRRASDQCCPPAKAANRKRSAGVAAPPASWPGGSAFERAGTARSSPKQSDDGAD